MMPGPTDGSELSRALRFQAGDSGSAERLQLLLAEQEEPAAYSGPLDLL